MSDKRGFVRALGYEDCCAALPAVQPFTGVVDEPDVFICALGFEDRAPAIAQKLAASVPRDDARRGLIFQYPGNKADNNRNRDALENAVHKFCGMVDSCVADVPQSIRQAVRRVVLGDEVISTRKVTFDISGASGNLILSVMYALIELKSFVQLEVLYSEPDVYFPESATYESSPQELIEAALHSGDESSMVEFGVAEVEINELYPGVDLESRRELVIAIPAFRTNRLVRCMQHLTDQPLAAPAESVYWILGSPPSTGMQWRTMFQRQIIHALMARLVGMQPSDVKAPKLTYANHEVCSTLDYRDILKTLLTQIDRRPGDNLSVVHMGSKLQAIGVALCLSVRSEVRVCGARPQQFNAGQYSRGVGAQWRVDLSSLAKVVRDLGRVGELVLETKIETSREPQRSI